jgi:subtilase family serine protease
MSLFPSGLLAAGTATIELSPMVAKSTLISPVDAAKEISVVLTIPLGDSKGAVDFAQRVSNPQDPLYRKYITPQEFAARFGANADDYAALKQWAINNGLRVQHEALARSFLTVRGTAAQFQTLFKTQLNNYHSPDGEIFYTAETKPTVPDAIASKVTGVIGLTNSIHYAPLAKVYKTFGENADMPVTDTAGGTGPGGAYSASDLRTAYQIPAFGRVTPQTVAIFEQGGFLQSDVEKYLNRMKLPQRPVTFVSVDGYNGSVNDHKIELEAVLDIDMVIGINPALKEVLVYEDGIDPLGVALIDALDQVAKDNKAQVLSISYGADEVQQGNSQLAAENTALTQLTAQGVIVLASSGDNGAYGRTGTLSLPAQLNAPDPGSQPLVTCVGGTSLSTGPNQEYTDEIVWNRLGVGVGASGGGVSSYWSLPSWQPGFSVSMNGGSTSNRNVPDVAAVADPSTGVAIYSNLNGGWLQIGGTSVSTPIWAGYLSILNAGFEYLVGQQIGFFNPGLYNLELGFGTSGNFLYAIMDGSNGNAVLFGTPGYNAGYPYNNCTGAGSLAAGWFAFQLLTSENGGTAPASFTVSTPKVTSTTATIKWTPAGSALGYVLGIIFPGSIYSNSAAFVTKDTTFTIKHLTPKTPYILYVAAVNQGGATIENAGFTTQ